MTTLPTQRGLSYGCLWGYAWLDYVLVFRGPSGVKTPCLSHPFPTSYPPSSLACPLSPG